MDMRELQTRAYAFIGRYISNEGKLTPLGMQADLANQLFSELVAVYHGGQADAYDAVANPKTLYIPQQ
ncbi:hypothetical protein Rhe02_55780 [Rhizocola hellebori]|uniref:Uncharacterized protein n=1 Tax=Rhizocola hellebori TaxID=1392758 RepID=A0A8J3VIX1_9ACTN|nr:hypothetical protein [Rhizocola hellebori]GIH07511.1 hypothetical protein Rhe02_55780 [Rhizocola hellebori]